MVWYVGIIGKIQNDEYLIYMLIGKVLNGTPSVFNKSLNHFWYKQFRNHFSPVMINTTHKNSCFNNQLKGNIPISSVVDQQTINPHNLFYQCSKYSPEFLFGKLRIRGSRYEPCFPPKRNYYHVKYKLICCLIIMRE